MPYLQQDNLGTMSVPADLEDSDEVFFCDVTNEIFTTYESFSYRVLELNSLSWTCQITGKTGLTYEEAQESEEVASDVINSVPEKLRVPALYFASLSSRTSLDLLVDDVYQFMKNHYFKGEEVKVLAANRGETCNKGVWEISNVLIKAKENEDKSPQKRKPYASALYQYEIMQSYPSNEESIESTTQYLTVGPERIQRRNGKLTKDKLHQLLSVCTVVQPHGLRTLRAPISDAYNIPQINFSDIFVGSPPSIFRGKMSAGSKFEKKSHHSSGKQASSNLHHNDIKKSKFIERKDGKRQENIEKYLIPSKGAAHMKDVCQRLDGFIKNQPGKVRDSTIDDDIQVVWSDVYIDEDDFVKSFPKPIVVLENIAPDLQKRINRVDVKKDSTSLDGALKRKKTLSSDSNSTKKKFKRNSEDSKIKQRSRLIFKNSDTLKKNSRKLGMVAQKSSVKGTIKQYTQKRELPIAQQHHDRKDDQRRSQEEEEEAQRQFEVERLRRIQEQMEKKAKREEEKVRFAKFMKEWRKNREDLECEDLKPMPVPHKIRCRVPNNLFGDFMMVLEFLYSFRTFLKVKSSFSTGVTFEYLERAVVEEEIAGPLNDIIQVLLTAIFDLQVAEHERPKTGTPVSVDLHLSDLYDQDMTPQEVIPHCIAATGWSNVFHSTPLYDLAITPVTISEVLRLHLLSSGGRAWDSGSKWLYYRGGYTNLDDPGLWFRVEHPEIILNLSLHHICELPANEKLQILSCLVNQILTYASVRDTLEERSERARQAKADVRSVQLAEQKLQKEAIAKRIKEKKEAKLIMLKSESSAANAAIAANSDESCVRRQAKLDREISKLKTDLQKKSYKILPLVMSHQLLPLGSDRAYRKYWLFCSLPGLFVENSPHEIGQCLAHPTPQKSAESVDILTHVRRLFEEESQNCGSDKENDASDGEVTRHVMSPTKKMLGEQNTSVDQTSENRHEEKDIPILESREVAEQELLICTASENCPVHCKSASGSEWSFFSQQEDVSQLLDSLNERGIRESQLRRALLREEQRVKESISQCPAHKLNPEKFQFAENEQRMSTRHTSIYNTESANLSFPAGTSVSHVLEYTLRDSILKMEEKLTSGCLGSLKVTDRDYWRNALLKGKYDKQCDKLLWGFQKKSVVEKDRKEEDGTTNESENNDPEEGEKGSIREEHTLENESIDGEKQDDHPWTQDANDFEEQSISNCGEETCYKNKDISQETCGEKDSIHSYESEDSESQNENKELDKIENSVDTHSSALDMVNSDKKGKSSSSSPSLVQRDRQPQCLLDTDYITIDSSSSSPGASPRSSRSEDENLYPEKRAGSSDADYSDIPLSTENNQCSSTKIHTSLEPVERNPVVEDLASAILQLEQSVDTQFLQKPLGEEEGSTSKSRVKYWEVSLMNTINFSQLFLHLTTLEQSIDWARSILNVPCYSCHRRLNPDKMACCAECNVCFHLFCLKPKLKTVPEGDWYCPECPQVVEETTESKRKSRMSEKTLESDADEQHTRRTSRSLHKEVVEDETVEQQQQESSSSEEETVESDRKAEHHTRSSLRQLHSRCSCSQGTCSQCSYSQDSARSSSPSPALSHSESPACSSSQRPARSRSRRSSPVRSRSRLGSRSHSVQKDPNNACHKCGLDGVLVYCVNCQIAYHPDCLNPPLRSSRRQKENWRCKDCRYQEDAASEDMEVPHVRERRGCASATMAKIATFTKRLRSRSWDEDESDSLQSPDSHERSLSCSRETTRRHSAREASPSRRSRRAVHASGHLPLDNAVLQDLLTELLQHEDSWPFLRPVRKSEAPDYRKFIKKPMDLGTIKYKLNTAEYSTNWDFIADMLLVFENCSMYNNCDADEYKCGMRLLQFFKNRCEHLGLDILET